MIENSMGTPSTSKKKERKENKVLTSDLPPRWYYGTQTKVSKHQNAARIDTSPSPSPDHRK